MRLLPQTEEHSLRSIDHLISTMQTNMTKAQTLWVRNLLSIAKADTPQGIITALNGLKELAKYPYIVNEIGGWEKAYSQLTTIRFRAKDTVFTPEAERLFEDVVALCRNTQYSHLAAYKKSPAKPHAAPSGLSDALGEETERTTSNPILSLAAARSSATRAAKFSDLALQRRQPRQPWWKPRVLCNSPGIAFYVLVGTAFALNVALLAATGSTEDPGNSKCYSRLQGFALFAGLLGLVNNAWMIVLFVIYLHKENRRGPRLLIVKRAIPVSSSFLMVGSLGCHIAGIIFVFGSYDTPCPSPLYEVSMVEVIAYFSAPVFAAIAVLLVPKFRKRAMSYCLRLRMRGELERKRPDLLDVVVNPAAPGKRAEAKKEAAAVVEYKGAAPAGPAPAPQRDAGSGSGDAQRNDNDLSKDAQ